MKMCQQSLVRIVIEKCKHDRIMLTYATNHHTVVDALEGVDGLADDELLF